ncbi:uncharacterized protein LOC134466619 [Engraulis encrasicolus]|uniref:uncharacterized protein LOC134466619 n=1 Tax=Engraulis encrasicolus TaxID=184585 RepID=UPI002FD4271A
MTDRVSHKWTGEQTRLLIKYRSENEKLFTKSKMAAKMQWQVFVKNAGLEGKVTGVQASKKWENLKQKYKEVRTPKTGSGNENGEYQWQYYEDMHAVMAAKHSIEPPLLGASLPLRAQDDTRKDTEEPSLDSSVNTESGHESPTPSTTKKKRKADTALEFLQEEVREEKKRFELQEAKIAERHEENAALMRQMLAICREMVDKM